MRYRNTPCGAPRSSGQQGYSLLELAVVVSLISVLAVVALPELRPSRGEKLDLAASRVAGALRFARTESIRTGDVHGVEILEATERVLASAMDVTPATPVALSTLIDPVTKQPLDFDLAGDDATAGVDVSTLPFSYLGLGDRSIVIFDAQGLPFWKSGGTFYHLDEGLVELTLGDQQRNVRLAPLTGRVTIE